MAGAGHEAGMAVGGGVTNLLVEVEGVDIRVLLRMDAGAALGAEELHAKVVVHLGEGRP